MRLEREGFFKDEKAASLGTNMVIPSSVSLACFWKVSISLVDCRYLRKVWNGPATDSS